jgi:hypothetical protein
MDGNLPVRAGGSMLSESFVGYKGLLDKSQAGDGDFGPLILWRTGESKNCGILEFFEARTSGDLERL